MLKIDQVKKGKKYVGIDDVVKTVLFVGHYIIVYEYKGLSCTPDALYETAVCTNSFLISHSVYKTKRVKKCV